MANQIPTLEEISGASRRASESESSALLLPQKLREIFTERFQTSPLIAQREKASSELLAAPERIRKETADITRTTPLTPTGIRALESSKRASAFAPLETANLLIGSQFGNLQDIITAGSAAATAQAGKAQKEASLLMDLRKQAMEELFKTSELQLKRQELARKSAGGAGLKTMSPGQMLINPLTGEVVFQAPKPLKLTTVQTTDLTRLNNVISGATKALELIKTKKVKTGPLDYLGFSFRSRIGTRGSTEAEYANIIESTLIEELNRMSGVAINPEEIRRMAKIIPSMSTVEGSAKQDLENLIKRATRNVDSITNTAEMVSNLSPGQPTQDYEELLNQAGLGQL